MPTTLDRAKVKQYLDDFDLRSLFTQELGWDYGGSDTEVTVKERSYPLQAVAHKRGMVAYQYVAQPGEELPDHPTRQQIERRVARQVREHIIIFANHDRTTQYWLWVKREPGRPDRPRTHIYRSDQSGEPLIQKLEKIVFTLEDEADLSIVDVAGHVLAAFDVEKVTKRFYDRFKNEHQDFLGFIEGIEELADREWYASLMLNRMMFIYFIQKRGFLAGNVDYLRDRLYTVRQERGSGKFASFYHCFLLKLFHEGLGQPKTERDADLVALIGEVPYLNGGLFDVHELERGYPDIDIPDEAFEKIFAFFDAYQWHLDDRPLRNDNEINPDVLGYIFEKYINQKQMGAYYTKEDITGYISRNTIIPFLFDRAKKGCSTAFTPGGGVWRLLQEDPDSYFYAAVRHGITYDIHNNEQLDYKQELPADIVAGLDDVAQRGGWNEPAPEEYALPTETWREHVARRRRYEEICAKLAAGEVTSINDLITYNLDIEKFALDVIANSEGSELVSAFWKALASVSVLDPTCGSGAFLFAALNILQPLYSACLEAMEGFLDDLTRSRRKHSPRKLSNFKDVIEEVGKHASEDYFILKSIIISNLYGVDIMEEAVEICKLRLFLKLVAQLETYDQIEPLPDIDFNVRAGNTLVGFTTLQEIQHAFVASPDGRGRILFPEDVAEMERIEEDAECADRAFQRFREMQTDHGMDASKNAEGKLDLQKRLAALRAELDRYLAKEYAIREGDEEAYAQWRSSHQPFHWFVEFYGIMHNGGFDVIVGNPPYVEYRSVKDYTVAGYETLGCGNLYAFIVERNENLSGPNGRTGMIVPHSAICTDRMEPVQELLIRKDVTTWVSSYDIRPARLFGGVDQRLAIYVTTKNTGSKGRIFSSRYHRWHEVLRNTLLFTIGYVSTTVSAVSNSVPKITSRSEEELIGKLIDNRTLGTSMSTAFHKDEIVYFHNGPRYWIRATDFAPYFWNERDGEQVSSHVKSLFLPTEAEALGTIAALNSSLFYWWFLILSNCRDLGMREIENFPLGLARMGAVTKARLCILAKRLMESFHLHKTRKETRYKTTGMVIYDEFNQKPSKPIVDEIDRVLAEHYGFTDEELDFIINYDIKYRMGL